MTKKIWINALMVCSALAVGACTQTTQSAKTPANNVVLKIDGKPITEKEYWEQMTQMEVDPAMPSLRPDPKNPETLKTGRFYNGVEEQKTEEEWRTGLWFFARDRLLLDAIKKSEFLEEKECAGDAVCVREKANKRLIDGYKEWQGSHLLSEAELNRRADALFKSKKDRGEKTVVCYDQRHEYSKQLIAEAVEKHIEELVAKSDIRVVMPDGTEEKVKSDLAHQTFVRD